MTGEPTPESIVHQVRDPDTVYEDGKGNVFEIYLPEERKPEKKKSGNILPWIIIGLIVIAGIAYYFWNKKKDGNTHENAGTIEPSPDIDSGT